MRSILIPIFQYYFLISYLRALMAVLIGFVLEQVSTTFAPLLISLPILIFYVIAKSPVRKYTVLANPIIWSLVIIIPLFTIKFYLICLGLSCSMLNIQNFSVKKGYMPLFVAIDILIRHPNLGQEPLFNLHTPWLLVVYIPLSLILTYFASKDQFGKKIEKQLINGPMLSQFQLLLVYLFFFGNPGIFTLNMGVDARISSLLLVVLVLVVLLVFSRGLADVIYFRFLIPITLLVSIYYYSWTNTIFLFIVGMYSFLALMNTSGRPLMTLGYLSFIVVSYFLLTSENILIPLLSLSLVLGLFHRDAGWPKIEIRFNRILVILILLLMISPYIIRMPHQEITTNDIRVLNYNIHFGLNNEGKDNVQSLISFISDQSPSIITLQEVVTNSPLNGFGNTFGILMQELEKTGFTYSYISEGGSYTTRNAIFSIFPIINAWTFTIDPITVYQRSFILVQLDLGNGKVLEVGTTHLTNEGPSSGTLERLQQVNDLLLEVDVSRPLVIAGDFNAIPSSKEYAKVVEVLEDSWSNNDTGFTAPADNPNKRIDYIFINKLTSTSCHVEQVLISDHLPLICDLELQ